MYEGKTLSRLTSLPQRKAPNSEQCYAIKCTILFVFQVIACRVWGALASCTDEDCILLAYLHTCISEINVAVIFLPDVFVQLAYGRENGSQGSAGHLICLVASLVIVLHRIWHLPCQESQHMLPESSSIHLYSDPNVIHPSIASQRAISNTEIRTSGEISQCMANSVCHGILSVLILQVSKAEFWVRKVGHVWRLDLVLSSNFNVSAIGPLLRVWVSLSTLHNA